MNQHPRPQWTVCYLHHHELAPVRGIEPRLAVLEAAVLPLNDTDSVLDYVSTSGMAVSSAPGGIRTRTVEGLSLLPLPLGYKGNIREANRRREHLLPCAHTDGPHIRLSRGIRGTLPPCVHPVGLEPTPSAV
jgi:hypothetical protein